MPSKAVVSVLPEAGVMMTMHAVNHPHDVVHGILLGTFSSDNTGVKVTDAVPVCHAAPTLPILETALGLIEHSVSDSSASTSVVVGWYVSPRLLQDSKPGPAALKIVAGLASNTSSKKADPVLLVLQNENLQKALQGDADALATTFKAYGKDFGGQWLDPLAPVQLLESKAAVAQVVAKAFQEQLPVADLVDHLEAEDVKAAKWFPNDSLKRRVKQASS